MILLIDNYDSFSYNLYQQAASIEPDMRVVRNDALTIGEIEGLNPSHIILSPGPGYPKDAGICEKVVKKLGGKIPILGVASGPQAICEAFGGRIRALRSSSCTASRAWSKSTPMSRCSQACRRKSWSRGITRSSPRRTRSRRASRSYPAMSAAKSWPCATRHSRFTACSSTGVDFDPAGKKNYGKLSANRKTGITE